MYTCTEFALTITSRRQMAGSPPNLRTMDSRSVCMQDVLKVKVKGHVIRALLCWHENRFFSQANDRIKASSLQSNISSISVTFARCKHLRAKSAIYDYLVVISTNVILPNISCQTRHGHCLFDWHFPKMEKHTLHFCCMCLLSFVDIGRSIHHYNNLTFCVKCGTYHLYFTDHGASSDQGARGVSMLLI